LLVAQEGAFGTHLLAADVVEKPIMFGQGGELGTTTLGLKPEGFGLAISRPVPHATAP
jgi:hypothetical protein